MKVRNLFIQLLQTQSLVILESSTGRVRLHEFVYVVQNLVDAPTYWLNTRGFRPEGRVYKKCLNNLSNHIQIGHLGIAKLMLDNFSIFYQQTSTCGGKYYKNND